MFRLFILLIFGFSALAALFFLFAPEADRAVARRLLGEVKNALYEEATLHNPEGDVVPDTIDDELLQRIRRYWEERFKRT